MTLYKLNSLSLALSEAYLRILNIDEHLLIKQDCVNYLFISNNPFPVV